MRCHPLDIAARLATTLDRVRRGDLDGAAAAGEPAATPMRRAGT
jgi:hypothetical protein